MYAHDFPDSLGGSAQGKSFEDRAWMTMVENSIHLVNGHYEIALPFRIPRPSMPNNREQAMKRAQHLKRKLQHNPEFRRDYVNQMNDMQNKGYMEEATESKFGLEFFLPHHGIDHPKKPDKMRIVFDCSAKFMNKSLNTELMTGPDLTNSLLGVLLRFRQEYVALVGDIEAMFHLVQVPPKDRCYLKFLWWPEGDTSRPLKEYQLTVHLFGAASSPSCANFALRKTAYDNQGEFSKEVTESLLKNFYVDDLLKSVPTVSQALEVQKEITSLCARGGFRLTKFSSNNQDVLNALDKRDKAKEMSQVNLGQEDVVNRALGVVWNVAKDNFGFSVPCKCDVSSRRSLLATVGSIYDPFGVVAPALLPARLAFRDLCSDKTVDWDDPLIGPIATAVKRWATELPELNKLQINRCVKPTTFGRVISNQLHHFSDASEKGYASVTFLRMVDDCERISVAFICGKARVAPNKTVSIPRLELTGAVLSTKLESIIKPELEVELEESVFWTDSLTVLKYISNKEKRFHTFVANRLAMIQDVSTSNQWRYVPTELNPADAGSRGISFLTLVENSMWLTGPPFLSLPQENWPVRCPFQRYCQMIKTLKDQLRFVDVGQGKTLLTG